MSAVTEIPQEQLSIAPPQARFSLAPSNLAEAMKFAEMMAASELVPKQFRDKPGDVLIAVQMGAEVGLGAMASIQNIAVINGKPGIYGDAGKAILLAAGCIIEEDDVEVVRQTSCARCKITRKGRPPVERTFSIEDAKLANLWNKDGPWKSYPYRQMAWRAFWFAARDAAADLLKGLGGVEELSDYRVEKNITPQDPAEFSAVPPRTDEQFNANKETWKQVVESGRKTPEQMIIFLETKAPLTEAQKKDIYSWAKKPAEQAPIAPAPVEDEFTAALDKSGNYTPQ